MGTLGGQQPLGMWRLWSPPAPGGGSGATGHVEISEPCQAVVLVPRSHGDARAILHRGRAWSHEAHGDSGALSYRVTVSMPRGTWQHQSPFLAGWRAWCFRACGDTRALSWWVACSVPWSTWRHWSPLLAGGVLCASGHVAESEPSGTRNGSGAVGLIF
jgi:hypothetical protein